MRGVQDRKQKKKRDLQVLTPFPGCLGRMINMFDLSNGVVATKMLTDKAHRDVSLACKDRGNAFKMAIGPFSSQIEDKKRDSQPRKQSPTKRLSSPTKRSGEAPVKILIEQDMWKEGMSGEVPLNVVARLMGLNDAAVQSDMKSGKISNKEYQSSGFDESSWSLRPKKESKCHQNQNPGTHSEPCGGFSDQTSRMNSSRTKYQGKEPSCEKRMTLVREKFAEAKRLATDEKLLHSKEFQETLQFLSSNKDLFLKFLDEPNPLLSNNNYEPRPATPPSETKQITILKPSESIKRNGSTLVGRQLYSDGDESHGSRCRHHQSLSVSPANSTFSEPTRIVVLKPGLVKSHEPKILRSPSSSSTAADSEDESMSAVEETVPSTRRMAKEITWQMRMRLKDNQDEENLLSYEFHDIYIGDDSFTKSEVENTKEVSGEISEDLEFGTPTSGRSWDFLSRSGSPYSASCSSQTSHRSEPSVVREAKKQILERLSMVSSTVSGEEEREACRSTGTLGEMLAIPEVKKDQEVFGGQVTLENPTPVMDPEEPFLCLPQSRSVPISLSFGGIELNGVATGSQKAEKEKNRKSLSFREKVSSLFSKNKKVSRGKLVPTGIPSTDDRLKHGNTATVSDFNENADHSALDNPLNCTLQSADEISMPTLMASSWHINDMENMPAKGISSIPVIGTPGIFGESKDQPSPVSVLDGPFLSENRSLMCSSESFIAASPQALSRSPLIGSFSRSLSWEDPPLEVMSPNSLRLSRLFSKADEDQDSLTFIQKLVCSAGIDREGCMLASPLDLELFEKFSYYQEEGIKLRERWSKKKFLFDAVNEALTELTWTAELMAYPWRRSFSLEQKDCEDAFSYSAADEIWRVIRNWSILDKYPPGETIERNLLVEMILKREVVEVASGDMTRLETFELTGMICAMVLEDLIADAVVDLSV